MLASTQIEVGALMFNGTSASDLIAIDRCDCICHRIEGVKHVVACCGVCPHCKKRIRTFALERHVPLCKDETEERMEELRKQIQGNAKTGP